MFFKSATTSEWLKISASFAEIVILYVFKHIRTILKSPLFYPVGTLAPASTALMSAPAAKALPWPVTTAASRNTQRWDATTKSADSSEHQDKNVASPLKQWGRAEQNDRAAIHVYGKIIHIKTNDTDLPQKSERTTGEFCQEWQGVFVLIKPGNKNHNIWSQYKIHEGNHIQNGWCSIASLKTMGKPQNPGVCHHLCLSIS